MEAYIFSAALRDMLRPKRLIPWMIVVVLIAVVGAQASNYFEGATAVQKYGLLSSMFVFRLVALASAVFSTAVIAQEVEQKTVVYLLTRPVRRWKILLFRTLASITAVIIICVLCQLCFGALVLGPSKMFGATFLPDLEAIVLGAAAYGGFFVFISLIANKATTICLLYAFGAETMFSNTPGSLIYGSIFGHMSGLAQHPSLPDGNGGALKLLAGSMGDNPIVPSTAVPAMILIAAVFMGIGCFWFSEFEYLPREDAE
ncbi:MAG: ABC transporter permease [Armatimonadetes bacterium]|nr:ABC transporter permease [Armatimonadota bacterium]